MLIEGAQCSKKRWTSMELNVKVLPSKDVDFDRARCRKGARERGGGLFGFNVRCA